MKAVRIQRFGGPDQVVLENVPVPVAGAGEILIHVRAAGVAPWDALIREGKSKVSPQPPLTLGSDLAGVVEAVGANVVGISAGDVRCMEPPILNFAERRQSMQWRRRE
jgi:NADPH:quinone reductase-like Zn-dependent oxidoreductase